MKPAAAAPRYLSLAADLRSRIERGELGAGDRLPSEAELSAANGVSRGTVVRAVEQLVAQGIVTRRQGSGSYVATRSLHRKAGHLLSFSESARQDGHRTEQRLLEFRNAEEFEARQFGVPTPAMLLARLRLIDEVPCAVHRSIVPHAICSRIDSLATRNSEELRRPDFSLYALFERQGLPIQEAQERVTARLCLSREAEILEIHEPSAVIVVFRLSYGVGGQLLEAVEAVYRADHYTYDIHLVRGQEQSSTGLRFEPPSQGHSNQQTRKPKRKTL